MFISPLKKKRATSVYSSQKKQNNLNSSISNDSYSPEKNIISQVKVIHFSQLQELKNHNQEFDFIDLANKRDFRLRYLQHQKINPSIYTQPEETILNNTFCKETIGQPDLLSQSALNFTKKQQTQIKNKEIKLFGQSTPINGIGSKKRNKTNLQNFTSQINKKSGKFQNLSVKVGLKNLLLGTNNTNDMNFDLSEKSSPVELDDNYDLEYEDIYLSEEYSHQSEEILRFVLKGKEYYSKQEPELIKKWIGCLPREERMEVEKDKTYFPVPHRLMNHQIDQGLNEIYGTGKNRILRPGEEATIIENISRFLQECQQIDTFHKMATSNVNSMLQYILKRSDMNYMNDFPLAMKQIECHWKIMATRFRCSDKMPTTHKLYEKYVYMAHLRGHFYQLQKKDNPLVLYLLRYSCMKADYLRLQAEIEKKTANRRKSFYNASKESSNLNTLVTAKQYNSNKQQINNNNNHNNHSHFNSEYIYAAD